MSPAAPNLAHPTLDEAVVLMAAGKGVVSRDGTALVWRAWVDGRAITHWWPAYGSARAARDALAQARARVHLKGEAA